MQPVVCQTCCVKMANKEVTNVMTIADTMQQSEIYIFIIYVYIYNTFEFFIINFIIICTCDQNGFTRLGSCYKGLCKCEFTKNTFVLLLLECYMNNYVLVPPFG